MPAKKNGNGSKKPPNSKAAKVGKNVLEYIKSWDQFGHPIGLSLGGEDTYKTWYGFIFTILIAGYMAFITYK